MNGTKDILIAALTALLGGGIGAAIIAAMNERWKFRMQRKAAKEDREAEKEDQTDKIVEDISSIRGEEEKRNQELEGRLIRMEKQLDAQSEGMRLLLLDRILYLGEIMVAKGEITYEERKHFHAMHTCYHDGLGGNGDADLILSAVDSLTLKFSTGDNHED